ncbi:MAG: glycerophosphoryl diester phosphodiesterase membrane domain-containing protein [Promicromonosporaceae bacterium]|nr:glycerophosphoryl diester phosphodiesterase membrane domain-containing protein [Promicromonosporaceae bacterium]
MTTPDEDRPTPPAPPQSGWGEVPRYGQYGQGYGQTPYAQPAPPYRPQADKPGIVPLRPLTLGEIYDGAFSAVRHNPAVMLGIATLVILAATVVGVLVGQLLVPTITRLFDPVFSDAAAAEVFSGLGLTAGAMAQTYATTVGAGVTVALAGPVVNGILTVSVSRSVLGDKASVAQVWERVGPRGWLLVGWSLLQSLALGVALGVAVTLGVLLVAATAQASHGAAALLAVVLLLAVIAATAWVLVRLLLVPPALALENARLGATVRRAWLLTRGSFWRIFGIYLLASVIVGVISQVVAVPLGLVGSAIGAAGGSETTSLVITTIVTSVVGTAISTIFLAGVVALLYIDQRMRREGLDVQLTAAAAERKG